MIRKRSLSWGAIRYQLSEDEETYWSVSSSRKSSKDTQEDSLYSLSGSQSTSRIAFSPVHTISPQNQLSKLSSETLVPIQTYPERTFRSASIPYGYKLNPRGSISVPEAMSSGQLSGRLSQVADELENSIKEIRRRRASSRHPSLWTLFRNRTNEN
ncbi:hypothetical protein PHET_04211 [Paragonimus heterotremus]|uniref:Uncharacterized protein n=1 Tax=Paragonimus heterotremus TaxID=100268 RepID=A0A8J4X0V1_9TREM|nr:hypothetical protein PHET_04211 [Paragonimus heterotremus]